MKKIFKNIYKIFLKHFFFIFYGKIVLENKKTGKIKIFTFKEKDFTYTIYKILNGSVYTNYVTDVSYIVNNKLIPKISLQFRNDKLVSSSENIVLWNREGITRIRKTANYKVFSSLTGAGGNNNYFHWIFDVLPRILIFKKYFKNVFKNFFFLIPNYSFKYQKETIKLLNLKKKIIDNKYNKFLSSPELWCMNAPNYKGSDYISKFVINLLRNTFLPLLINTKKKPLNIYISRNDTLSNLKDYRKISNEVEVLAFLKKKGFKILNNSNFSFLKQIEIFYNARIIVGLHGAGFSNLIFCKKNTKVIEIKPKNAQKMYKNISNKVGLKYKSIEIQPEEKSIGRNYGILTVNLEKLKKLI